MATTDATVPTPPCGVAVHQGRIVIVDDEPRVLTALCQTLAERGDETQGCATGTAALAALPQTEADVLLSDLMMPEMDGTTLLAGIVASALVNTHVLLCPSLAREGESYVHIAL